MKYEEPMMEVIYLEEKSVYTTGLDVSGAGTGGIEPADAEFGDVYSNLK